jgi:hypothetical protein
MAISPCPLAPPAFPTLASPFTLANNFGPDPCGALVPSRPAPWSFTLPFGVPIPVTLTVQGVLREQSSLSITNGLVLRIR